MTKAWDLNNKNFLIMAMKVYNTNNLALSEFETDIKRIKYIKRLIKQYKVSHDLKERLILNHIIILANVFGVEATTKMLFHRIDQKYWDILKVFLLYLNYLPDKIDSINSKIINTREIPLDMNVVEKLRNITRNE